MALGLFSFSSFIITMVSAISAEDRLRIGPTSGPPYVVTSFEGLPLHYSMLRIQNPQGIFEINPQVKDDICYRTYHHFGDVRWIRPEHHETELRENHPDIFDDLFELVERDVRATELNAPSDEDGGDDPQPAHEAFPEDEDAHGFDGASIVSMEQDEGPTFRYGNFSRPRAFLVGETAYTLEITFVCLFRSTNTGGIQPYYVSDYGYNVNEAPLSPVRLEGRFIFFNDRLRALAEKQPIQRRSNPWIHGEPLPELSHYGQRHIGRAPAVDVQDDPVCRLDNGRKLRLCTSVCMFLVPGCRIQVMVDEECRMKRFHLDGVWYHEWTLECNIGNQSNLRRNVSHGYSDNEVFVFTVDDRGEILTWHGLENVGVIIDNA